MFSETKHTSLLVFFLSLFFFLTSSPVAAVTTKITEFPNSISLEPFRLTVTINGAAAGTNYLRLDLYLDGSKNYFGETFNGETWYGESEGSKYLPITIEKEATWSGVLLGRLGQPSGAEYPGPGSYKARVRRYTGSGNYNADEANAGAVVTTIDVKSATPTPPKPTSSPPTQAPTKQPASPVSTLHPTVKPTLTPLLSNLQVRDLPDDRQPALLTNDTATANQAGQQIDGSRQVIGRENQSLTKPSENILGADTKPALNYPSLFITVGGFCLLFSSLLLGRKL